MSGAAITAVKYRKYWSQYQVKLGKHAFGEQRPMHYIVISSSFASYGTIQEGTSPVAVKGQKVIIEYTGWVKDASKPNNRE